MNTLPIITIDGPAGVGKTTLAKVVAERLDLAYLDTGAMFRCFALMLGESVHNLSEAEIEKLCQSWSFRLSGHGADTKLICNDNIIGDEIRTESVGMLASKLGTIPIIREILKKAQRDIGHNCSLVAEGRDMGTVVFATAQYKFFLDASPKVRAKRRQIQLAERGEHVELESLIDQIQNRDEQDKNRPIAPLCAAHDAIFIDTSNLNIDFVLKAILDHVQQFTKSC